MALWKMTVMFGSNKFGWSESWWNIADDDMIAMGPLVSRYIAKRAKTLPPTVVISGVRLSKDGANRFGRVFLPGSTQLDAGTGRSVVIPANGTCQVAVSPWDQARVAMQMGLYINNIFVGRRYFAILPDAVTGDDFTTLVYDAPGPAPTIWWDNFNAWKKQVLDDHWRVKMSSGPVAAGLDFPIIAWGLSAGAATDLTATVSGDLGALFNVGDKVVVRKTKMKYRGVKSPNGVWRVSAVTVGVAAPHDVTVTLKGSNTLSPDLITSNGFIRRQIFTAVQPDAITPLRCGIHKRGGPFFVTAGRRSTPSFAP